MNDHSQTHSTTPGSGTWWIFALFGILFLIYGIYAFALPYIQPSHWSDITSSQETTQYIADNFRWLGLLSFMFGLLTLTTAAGAYRRGDRWAWFAFLSFPLFFLLAVLFTWPGLLWSPLLLASILALVLPARRFLPPA